MKLIELVVGYEWPEGADYVVQDSSGLIKWGANKIREAATKNSPVWIRGDEIHSAPSKKSDDWLTSVITRETYQWCKERLTAGFKFESDGGYIEQREIYNGVEMVKSVQPRTVTAEWTPEEISEFKSFLTRPPQTINWPGFNRLPFPQILGRATRLKPGDTVRLGNGKLREVVQILSHGQVLVKSISDHHSVRKACNLTKVTTPADTINDLLGDESTNVIDSNDELRKALREYLEK